MNKSTRLNVVRALLIASTAIIPVASTSAAHAQTGTSQQASFDLPAQPLSDSLAAFARATNLRLVYPAALAQGRSAPALRGPFTHAEALERLLSGSGLAWRFTGGNAVTIYDNSGAAAEAQIDADGSLVLDTISVTGTGGTLSADAPYETPGSGAYISAEDINRVPPSSQADIFKATPGVISSGSRAGQGLDLNIRGLQGMNRVATLIDGTQQSTGSYSGYRGQTSSVFVDPDLIAGIDITKGPSDGPLGNGAMGGVVNMRTLNARDIVADGQQYGARIRATVGGNTMSPGAVDTTTARNDAPLFFNGDSFNGSIAAATIQDNFEFLAAVTRRKTGNYFAGNNGDRNLPDGKPLSPVLPGHEVFNTSEDSFSALLKGKVYLSEDAAIELSYMRYENSHGELDDFPYLFTYLPPSQKALNRRNVDTVTARFTYDPADNPLWNLNASAWLSHVNRYAPTSFDGNATVTTYGAEIFNTSRLDTSLGYLALTYGVQASLEDAQGNELWIPQSWDPDQFYLSHAGPTGKRTLASAFARAKLDVTEWLSLGAGLRYDTYHTEQGPGALAGYGDMSGARFNPSLSVTIEPWDGVQFFGQYVQGWRPPTLRETNYKIGSILSPNPDLRPERAENFEAGLNVLRSDVFSGGDSLKFKASYFNNTYKDYIIRDSIAKNWSEPRHWANIPSAAFQGFEISFKYDAERFFLESGLTKYTNVEYCHELTGCANKSLGVDYGSNYVPPDYSATLGGGVRLFDQKLTLGARATFVGERAITETMGKGVTSPTMWPKSTVVDLFGSYEISPSASINVSVENLTDQYYLDALSFTRAPAPGRTIRAGFTAKF